jgi:phosphomannomutase
MNGTIFKAYDIRGLSPQELDASIAGRIGQAIGALHKPKRVVVGHDMRETSEALEQALIEGLRSQGVDVVLIGLCSTPMFNFTIASSAGAYDLGVMITASHNPKEYNGMKLALKDNLPIGLGSGLDEIRDLVIGDMPLPSAKKQGKIEEDTSVLDRYTDAMWDASGLDGDFTGWRIAADCGNGMNGITMPKIKAKLSAGDIYPLFWELDGSFPNHEANPMKTETLKDLQSMVLRRECQFGVAFDGDGDRVGFVDEEGEAIPGDIMTALLAEDILATKPGSTILYDGRSSRIVPESIEAAGGKAVMLEKLGHSNIKRQMRETGAAFAGELSMHYYFDFLNGCEATDLVFLMMIKRIKREEKRLSAIWKPYKKYFHSGELNFTVKDAKKIIGTVGDSYEGQGTRSVTDGLRIDFGTWWFSLRASNTEPLLRLNLEAVTEEEMQSRLNELKTLIG